jgi:hypothetical protein
LKHFTISTDLLFTDIDQTFLHNYEIHLRKLSLKEISISVYFRTLRAVFNKAIQDIEQVEKWLAQSKTQKSSKVELAVNSTSSSSRPAIQKEHKPYSPSFFLSKAWYKLGFSQPQEEATGNILERLKKRRKKRKLLNLS